MKKVVKVTGIVFGIILSGFSVWHLTHAQSIENVQDVKVNFEGDILAISDADMISGAYANGILNKVEGIEDQLTLITNKNGSQSVMSQLHVSNSVISWPAIVEWNDERKLAYISETRGVHREESQRMDNVFKDFPVGKTISVVDYRNREAPKIIQQKTVGENIQGVSMNNNRTLLASGSTEKKKELIVMTLDSGLIANTFYFTNQHIDAKDTGNGGIRTIEFHPKEDVIAVNLNNTHLVFYQIIYKNDIVEANQIGQPLEVGKRWSVGNWHPSGKYFIISDVAWGNGLGQILHGKGKLVSVEFSNNGNHKIVGEAQVGLSPEGFDISPDGNYAVAVNMRRTWAPKKGFWFVPARKTSSLSLVKIDSNTGELTKLGKDYGFKGALPEDAVFDKESNSIAVAVYQDRQEEFPKEGWIDYWELNEDKLVYTGKRLNVTRGVHNLLLIP